MNTTYTIRLCYLCPFYSLLSLAGCTSSNTVLYVAIDGNDQYPGTLELFINGHKQIRARYPNYDPDIEIFNGYSADALSLGR